MLDLSMEKSRTPVQPLRLTKSIVCLQQRKLQPGRVTPWEINPPLELYLRLPQETNPSPEEEKMQNDNNCKTRKNAEQGW